MEIKRKVQKFLSLCSEFDKGKRGVLRRDVFFLLATRLHLPIPLDQKALLVDKYGSHYEINYVNAINDLFPPSLSSKPPDKPKVEQVHAPPSKTLENPSIKVPSVRLKKDLVHAETLRAMQNELRKKRGQRSISSRRAAEQSYNIITNKDVDYFTIDNYIEPKVFKKVNDTSEARRKQTNAAFKKLKPIQKYNYSGWRYKKDRLQMIYEQNVEYRHLNILRVAFLREVQENGGVIHVDKFRTMLKCVIRNVSKNLEDFFIEQVKEDKSTVSYQKFCDIINLYQYNIYFVKKKDEYDLRPKTTLGSNQKVPKDLETMDNIVDYIWCRLSEKYIKLSKAFRGMDITIRGKINFHEFKYGLENLHIRLPVAQIERLFRILDQDSDGFLNFPEFSLLAKGNLKEIMESNNTSTESKKCSTTSNYFRSRSVISSLSCLIYKIERKKNASVVGQLILGKPLDYDHLVSDWGYHWDENFKIYPTEKKDWTTIRQETLQRRRQLDRRSKVLSQDVTPNLVGRNFSRGSIRSQHNFHTTSTGSQSFCINKRTIDTSLYKSERKV